MDDWDPSLRWNGKQWLRWNGRDWIDADAPASAETPPGETPSRDIRQDVPRVEQEAEPHREPPSAALEQPAPPRWTPGPPEHPDVRGRFVAWGLLAMIVIVAAACVVLVISAIRSAESAAEAARAAENAAAIASCQGLSYPNAQPGRDICGRSSGSVAMDGIVVTAGPLDRFKLSPGRKELCSNVTIRNASGGPRPYGTWDFKVQTPTGEMLTDSTAGIAGDLDSGVLQNGQERTGRICTRFTGETGQYVFIYDPGAVSDNRGIWVTYVSGA